MTPTKMEISKYLRSAFKACLVVATLSASSLSIGCKSSSSSNNNSSTNLDTELRLSSGITTRAYNTTWEENDVIGVYMLENNSQLLVGEKNTPYTTLETSTLATFSAVGTPLYYPDEGLVDVLAYYPYDDQIDNGVYEINTTDQSEPNKIDLLVAWRDGVDSDDGTLSLDFEHVLSKIAVTLKADADSGFTNDELAKATITLSGVLSQATYTLYAASSANQISFTSATSEDITLNSDDVTSSNLCFSAILIPQTVSSLSFTISIPSYSDVSIAVSESKEFKTNTEHTYTLRLTSDTKLEFDGSKISEWGSADEGEFTVAGSSGEDQTTTSSYSVGDPYPNVANPIGIVYSTADDGKSGMVVSLVETSNLTWSSEKVTTGANSLSDGLANMKVIVDSYTLSDYAAFNYVNNLNTMGGIDTNGYASGSKGVWYLPSPKELQALYAAMCGVTIVESDPQAGEVADWGVDGASMDSYANYTNAVATFNSYLSAIGGSELSISDNVYMSSAESEAGAGVYKYADFRSGCLFKEHSKTDAYTMIYTRAVMQF